MRPTAIALAAAAALLALAGGALAAVTIYRNGFPGPVRMSEMRKVSEGGSCGRSNAGKTMSVRLGRRTLACSYRTPAIGKDLEIAVTGELSRKTPAALRRRVALAVAVRSGVRSDYTLTVYPGRRRWVLSRAARPAAGEDVTRTTLGAGREDFIRGSGRRNRLRIRAFGDTITAWVNEKIVARYTDPNTRPLTGRQATVSLLADRAARGGVARFDSVTVLVPDPA